MRSFNKAPNFKKVAASAAAIATLLGACNASGSESTTHDMTVTHERISLSDWNSICKNVAVTAVSASEISVSAVLDHSVGNKVAVLVNTYTDQESSEADYASPGLSLKLPLVKKGDEMHVIMAVENFNSYNQVPSEDELNRVPNSYLVPSYLCPDVTIQR